MVEKLNVATVVVEDLNTMEKDELAKICKRTGIHPGGRKELLIERIKAFKDTPTAEPVE